MKSSLLRVFTVSVVLSLHSTRVFREKGTHDEKGHCLFRYAVSPLREGFPTVYIKKGELNIMWKGVRVRRRVKTSRVDTRDWRWPRTRDGRGRVCPSGSRRLSQWSYSDLRSLRVHRYLQGGGNLGMTSLGRRF